MENPFRTNNIPSMPGLQTVNAEERIEKVKEFDIHQLKAALKVPGLQKTVRLAVERRLRKLAKQK